MRSGDTQPPIFLNGISWEWGVSFTRRPLHPSAPFFRHTLCRRLGGPRRGLDEVENINVSVPFGDHTTIPRAVSPQPISETIWNNQAPISLNTPQIRKYTTALFCVRQHGLILCFTVRYLCHCCSDITVAKNNVDHKRTAEPLRTFVKGSYSSWNITYANAAFRNVSRSARQTWILLIGARLLLKDVSFLQEQYACSWEDRHIKGEKTVYLRRLLVECDAV